MLTIPHFQAAFVASIQAQIMSTTVGTPASDQDAPTRAINAFYIGGLVLDILAGLLAFLTTRWFERLTDQEKDFLEERFSYNASNGASRTPNDGSFWRKLFYSWLALSLFVPMSLLIIGVVCMLVGIYIYAWVYQPTVVAVMASIAGAAILPFIIGDFAIGRGPERRRRIISRLSEMQGDW